MNCCGASGPSDYRHSAWFNRSRPVEEVFVPASCCVTAAAATVHASSWSSVDEDRRRDASMPPTRPSEPREPRPLCREHRPPCRPSEPRDQDSCQLNAILFPNNDKSSRSLRTQVTSVSLSRLARSIVLTRGFLVVYLKTMLIS